MSSATLEVLDGFSNFRQGEPKQTSAIVGVKAQRVGDARHKRRRKSPAQLTAFERLIPPR
jgi:hypothetical protein